MKTSMLDSSQVLMFSYCKTKWRSKYQHNSQPKEFQCYIAYWLHGLHQPCGWLLGTHNHLLQCGKFMGIGQALGLGEPHCVEVQLVVAGATTMEMSGHGTSPCWQQHAETVVRISNSKAGERRATLWRKNHTNSQGPTASLQVPSGATPNLY